MKFIAHAAVSLVLAGFATGCKRDVAGPDEIPPGAETGQLRVFVTTNDNPGDYDPRVEELWVRFDSLQVRHEDEGWIEVMEERQDLDLIGEDVRGGNAIVADSEVWVGSYDQIRLGFEDAWIVVDGQEQDLRFQGTIDPLDPMWMGLVLEDSFYVDRNELTTVRISFNVADNLEENDGDWSLTGDTTVEVEIGGEGDQRL